MLGENRSRGDRLANLADEPYIIFMHELSIAQDILEIVRQNLPAENAPPVRKIKIRIGDMAGVVADSLEFCFRAITSNTSLESADLVIEHVPVVLRCTSCGRDKALEHFSFLCPLCGSTEVTMLSGNELQVVEIEVDDTLAEAKWVL